MNAKEILEKVKGLFNQSQTTPAQATAPVALAAKTYKLQDGTEVSVSQSGDVVAVGDMVTINGAPAPSGEWTLEDGSKWTTDETGKIIVVTPVAAGPVTQEDLKTPEQMMAAIQKFAEPGAQPDLQKMATILKAVFEYNFGWQLRESEEKATRDAAIAAYKTGFEAQEQKLKNQDEIIKGMFELCEKLVELPAADPKTLTDPQQQQFKSQNKKEEKLKAFGESIKKLKEEKQ